MKLFIRLNYLCVFFTLFSAVSMGQGIVRGKITDDTGQSVIGATIVLKSNLGYGTVSDFDGNYSLKITDPAPQVIVVSFIGFNKIEYTVNPTNNGVVVKNFNLVPVSQEIIGVEITGKAVKEKSAYMEKMKINSATTIDYISSESIKRIGDSQVASAVARVAGVSTNGSFITVRGIGDRYVKTGLNGCRIPTLDPFTNNIKLDIFPASLIDNLVISKTSSPDLPGDWAGAYLSVETKDFPEELSLNVETSFGYNSQASLRNIISSQRSNTDWLGFDGNFRDRSHEGFVNANINPTQFEQFVALGLGSYFAGLGITEQNWNTNGEDYFKLGLVQLGLLAPALFNDASAVALAKSQFLSSGYVSQAFNIINKDVPGIGKSFPVNWNLKERYAPLNFSQSFSIGNQIELFGKPLGFITAFRYQTSNQYDPNAEINRAAVASDTSGGLVNTVSSALQQQASVETNGWNALLSGSYKYHPNHSVSVLFMPNFIGTNRVRKSFDFRNIDVVATLSQQYEQRRQVVYQLKSENYLPKSKVKIESIASYTKGRSSTPDFKNLQYLTNSDFTSFQIGGSVGDGIHRYFRYLDDNMFDGKAAVEFPLSDKPFPSRKLKFGGSYQRNDQAFDQYDYFILTGPEIGAIPNDDIDAFLNESQYNINSGVGPGNIPYSTINAYYQELGNAANHTFGHSTTIGSFAMIDYGINEIIRLAGGLRFEQAYVFTDVVEFYEKGYVRNDPRRVYAEGLPIANPGNLEQTSFLPMANLIYKLDASEEHPMNLRANYSKTVARPGIREISDIAVVDYELRAPVFGNSDLKPVQINNYDIRWESYRASGSSLTLSVFHKDFKNHIELVNANGYTWQNVDKSSVSGLEFEFKTKPFKNIECSSNITLAKSTTTFIRTRFELANGIKVFIPLDTVTRSMYGQAPYVFNAMITYKRDSLGLTLTAAYNLQGPRLVISSNVKEIPDVYELARHLIDIKASKKLGKHFTASFTVKDLLNSPIRRAYNYDEGFDVLDYDRYNYGTNYIFTLAYKL